MIYAIHFDTESSFEKGLYELQELERQLMGDMKLTVNTDELLDEIDEDGEYIEGGEETFIMVELEDFNDTIALMKVLQEMAVKGIQWELKAHWFENK